GKLLSNLRSLSRVVGGMTPETAETMTALYWHVVQAELDQVDCVTAELVKTVENAYRDVQIAFANEVALICEAVGGDVWKVRELVNKTPYRNMHLPGAGVGGHCIPKDPWLLAYGVKDKGVPLRLIPAARAVNDAMPIHMADLVLKALTSAGRQISESRILILGYAYLEDSEDTRNSPSETLVARLKLLGADVVIHDPYIPKYQGDVYQVAEGCNVAVFMVRHKQYLELDLHKLRDLLLTPLLVDGRRVIGYEKAKEIGFLIQSLGSG
ncbi:MAG: nucleotide sugar dehydrogenase, partial [Bacteroidales bacterium]|nr:nucleotide sugar dehydrogenase [Bacteroidales bacterium]